MSAVINLVYLAARDQYRVEREAKDGTPEKAIQQIKDKNYALRFKGNPGEKLKYTGKILGIGISYDKKTKKHSCKIEEL